jgi:hypothetical protein
MKAQSALRSPGSSAERGGGGSGSGCGWGCEGGGWMAAGGRLPHGSSCGGVAVDSGAGAGTAVCAGSGSASAKVLPLYRPPALPGAPANACSPIYHRCASWRSLDLPMCSASVAARRTQRQLRSSPTGTRPWRAPCTSPTLRVGASDAHAIKFAIHQHTGHGHVRRVHQLRQRRPRPCPGRGGRVAGARLERVVGSRHSTRPAVRRGDRRSAGRGALRGPVVDRHLRRLALGQDRRRRGPAPRRAGAGAAAGRCAHPAGVSPRAGGQSQPMGTGAGFAGVRPVLRGRAGRGAQSTRRPRAPHPAAAAPLCRHPPAR